MLIKSQDTLGAPPPLRLDMDARPHRGTVEYPGGQVALIRGCLKYPIFTAPCGRRVGKTTSIFFKWLEMQGRKKGMFHAGYIGTDHPKGREFFEAFLKCMGGDPKNNPESLVVDFRRDTGQDRWIRLAPLECELPDGTVVRVNDGGKYYFWSGQHPNYEAIQGFIFPFDDITVDEMQLQQPALVTDIVVPMLMDSGGHLMLTGHAKRGRPGNHLFHEYYDRGMSRDPKWSNYGALNMPSESNPFIKRSVIKQGRLACLTKQQEIEEYDGIFVDDSGGVFPNIKAVMCLPKCEPPEWYIAAARRIPLPGMRAWFHEDARPRHKYVIGIDWGKLQDATVISVFDRMTNKQVALFHIRGEDYEDQLKWVHEIRKRYNKAIVNGDHNGVGEAMGERLRRKYRSGYRGHKFSGVNKEMYVRQGQIVFKESLVELIDTKDQEMEFRLFSVIPPKSDDGMGGKSVAIRYGHPPNKHDDFVDAFLVITDDLSSKPKKVRPLPKKGNGLGTMGYIDAMEDQKHRAQMLNRGRIR